MSLYEPLLERDVAGIRAAVREYRQSHSMQQLFETIARFAVLAYAPSQHGKHAVIACLSAQEAGLSDELLTECAIYAAMSRQPWSEPPIGGPPPIDADQRGDADELREAIAAGDRLRAERWLAKAGLCRDYFAVAADDFEDLGHKLIVAVTASKLGKTFDTLRIGVWEMVSYQGERYVEQGRAADPESLFACLIENMVAEKGSVVSAHPIFLLDAAMETGDDAIIRRVSDFLWSAAAKPPLLLKAAAPLPQSKAYPLARDYGSLLKCHAVAKRLLARFPALNTDAMIAAAAWNLEHEDYSLA